MSTDQDTLKLRDVANAAGVLAEAARSAPDRELATVRTPYGEADVILDDAGADVVLDEGDVTVHVRLPGAENAI